MQNPAANAEFLSNNNLAFMEGDAQGELDYRQLDVSRAVLLSLNYEHAASVIVRDDPIDFSADEIEKYGEPIEIEGEGVGYILEALNIEVPDSEAGDLVNKLVLTINGQYILDDKNFSADRNDEGETKTETALNDNTYTRHGERDSAKKYH